MNKLIKAADRLGMAGAVLCALHCIAVPVLIMTAPMLAWLETGEQVHEYLAVFSILAVFAGLVPGYMVHRRQAVLAWGVSGLLCINSAVWLVGPLFGESAEMLMTLTGAAMLFAAHFQNRRCCALC